LALVAAAGVSAQPLVAYRIDGDGIRLPLSGEPGNASRGRDIVQNRNEGACVLCHAVPEAGVAYMGNIAPTLAGVGARLSEAQLRLRVVDSTRINSNTPMPAYYRVEGLNHVAPAFQGKPILSAQQVEDVVAYLQSLRAAP
jgi:sulfur-oxidizing protein SoxX